VNRTPAPRSLALVIPVYDDADGVCRLLDQVSRLAVCDEVIVVDDRSPVPLDPGRLRAAAGKPEPRIEVLQAPRRRGAGAARNTGLGHVAASHVLFFDADDTLTDELGALWRSLPDDADICLFRHADAHAGGGRLMPFDERLWQRAGACGALQRVPHGPALEALARTANYPWNRVYRTEFLRRHGLRFSETPVHNDVLMHWQGLARVEPGRLWVSDRICALHNRPAATGRTRLTGLSGRQRLAVFQPIDALIDDLHAHDSLGPAFRAFATGLLDWARDRLRPDLVPRFDRRRAWTDRRLRDIKGSDVS